MKRFLSLFSFCALMVAHSASAAKQIIYHVNVDRSGKTKYQQNTVLSDWDDVLAKDLSNAGKKWKGLFFGPKLWRAASGIKEARINGQPLEGLTAHLDYMIAKEPKLAHKRAKLMWKLNKAEPHVEIIACIQQLQERGAKLIIATNQDMGSIQVKTKKINAKLRKKGRKILAYDGCYCAGLCPEIKNGRVAGIPAGSVYAGKNTDEYFEQLFRFAETEFGCDRKNTLFIFVDDLKHNIDRACKVAAREGVALIAVHKNCSDKKVVAALRSALDSLTVNAIFNPLRKQLTELGAFVIDEKTQEFKKA